MEAKGIFGKGQDQTGQFGVLGGVGELIRLALPSNSHYRVKLEGFCFMGLLRVE